MGLALKEKKVDLGKIGQKKKHLTERKDSLPGKLRF
jgi:hypothetical protein